MYPFLKPGEKLLTGEEIEQRLDKFNETEDWSVFHDVPQIQQVSVMYPSRIKLLDIDTF